MYRLRQSIQQHVVLSCSNYWMQLAIIFIVYVLTSKLSEFLYYTYEISPAILWPSLGFSIAAMYLYGYRVWPAVTLGQFVIMATTANVLPFPVVILSTFAYTLQPLVGCYLLRRLGYESSMSRTRDALVLIMVSLAVPIVAPAITTVGRILADSLTASVWVSINRGWAAGVLSILVITPLITSWARLPKTGLGNTTKEAVFMFVLLLASVYITFWTDLAGMNTFVILYGLFAVLIWIALRGSSRYMTLAMFLVATVGIAGVLIAQPSDNPVNRQVLSTQLFIMLIAPIYYVLASVIEEQRRSQYSQAKYSRELEHALTQLAHEDRTKTEFIAILAHELRNPLAPLMSTIELLRLRDPVNKELWEPAYNQLLNMRRLLDDLLDVSRVAQNKFKLKLEIVNLRDVVRHSILSVTSHFAERNHKLDTDIQEGDLYVCADPVRFEQILNNLLHNAAKYTQDGGKIKLRVRQTNTHTYAEVSDNGTGVPFDMQELIFEPFRQAREPQQFGTGLGIGLAITKRLVELHHGEISVVSDGPGKGSSFRVTFPNEQPSEPSVDTEDTDPDSTVSASKSDPASGRAGTKQLHLRRTDTLTASTP